MSAPPASIGRPGDLAIGGWVALEVPAGLREREGRGTVVGWARRALTRGRPLPAGGVLLEIAVDVPVVGTRLPDSCRVDVETRERDGRLPVVTARVSLAAAGHPCGTVAFVLLWPGHD